MIPQNPKISKNACNVYWTKAQQHFGFFHIFKIREIYEDMNIIQV